MPGHPSTQTTGAPRRLFGPVPPRRWLRRRRWLVGLAMLGILALAGYDHLQVRSRAAASATAAGPRGDIACYDGRTFRAIQAVDGDTVHLDAPDGRKPFTIVRLWGVDTPEVYGADRPAYFGPEASRFTRAEAEGKPVRLELVSRRTRDRYGRLLAYVYLPDGRMLNERLLVEGFAYADSRFAHPLRARFRRLESQARTARAGLWAGVTPADMPAWRRAGVTSP